MYFFMTVIYLFTTASFLAILTAGLQGYFGFLALGANHPTFSLLASILYLFTEVLVMFFFVGTGASIKEYVTDKGADPEFHRRSTGIKRKLYPPTLINVVMVMAVFITGGAVDTGLLPDWSHGVLFLLTIIHFGKTINVQHRCLKENTAIIVEMTGAAHSELEDK